MKVYVVVDSGGYEGENYAEVVGIYSTKEKAKERFTEQVDWTKSEFDGNWEIDEKETEFCASEIGHCSRNWCCICVEEREVI